MNAGIEHEVIDAIEKLKKENNNVFNDLFFDMLSCYMTKVLENIKTLSFIDFLNIYCNKLELESRISCMEYLSHDYSHFYLEKKIRTMKKYKQVLEYLELSKQYNINSEYSLQKINNTEDFNKLSEMYKLYKNSDSSFLSHQY